MRKQTLRRWQLDEQDKQLVAEGVRALKEQKRLQIERARSLEEALGATVVGVWGHLTGKGAREYAVYKKKDTEDYFVVTGRTQEGTMQTQPIDPKHTPNQMKIRSLEEFLA